VHSLGGRTSGDGAVRMLAGRQVGRRPA